MQIVGRKCGWNKIDRCIKDENVIFNDWLLIRGLQIHCRSGWLNLWLLQLQPWTWHFSHWAPADAVSMSSCYHHSHNLIPSYFLLTSSFTISCCSSTHSAGLQQIDIIIHLATKLLEWISIAELSTSFLQPAKVTIFVSDLGIPFWLFQAYYWSVI